MPAMPTDPHDAKKLVQLNAADENLQARARDIPLELLLKGEKNFVAEKEALLRRIAATDPNREVATRALDGAETYRKMREAQEKSDAKSDDLARRARDASAG